MSRRAFLTCIAALVMTVAVAVAAEKPWLDMENCEFCKPWVETGLMKEMTHEQLPMMNGVMTVMTLGEKRWDDYKKTSALMSEIGKRAMAGEPVKMCGSCEAMGSFFARGARWEEIWTKTGPISLLTSTDSTVVAGMHQWAQKNNEEYAKLKGHKG